VKQFILLIFITGSASNGLTVNEIGPEGHKLVWILVFAVAAIMAVAFLISRNIGKTGIRFVMPGKNKVDLELQKDRLYYPRFLELTVTNNGAADVDLGNPMLILSSIWVTRKFKLKGTNTNWFYPLYLMKNQSHTLNIDLHRFYGFDRTLKRLPRAKVVVTDVNGRQLASRRVLLRKTLFNF
jgi:hypothetical protein